MIKLKSLLLLESKQDIVNLGYPELIASMFYQKLGNLAFIIAKWYKDYHHSSGNDKGWFKWSHNHSSRSLGIADMVGLYYSTDNIEHYLKEKERII